MTPPPPFAGLESFDDCVAANRGKVNDPEAYCGAVKARVENAEGTAREEVVAQFFKEPVPLNPSPPSPIIKHAEVTLMRTGPRSDGPDARITVEAPISITDPPAVVVLKALTVAEDRGLIVPGDNHWSLVSVVSGEVPI